MNKRILKFPSGYCHIFAEASPEDKDFDGYTLYIWDVDLEALSEEEFEEKLILVQMLAGMKES